MRGLVKGQAPSPTERCDARGGGQGPVLAILAMLAREEAGCAWLRVAARFS